MLRNKLTAGPLRRDNVAGSTADMTDMTKIEHVTPSRDDGMSIRQKWWRAWRDEVRSRLSYCIGMVSLRFLDLWPATRLAQVWSALDRRTARDSPLKRPNALNSTACLVHDEPNCRDT